MAESLDLNQSVTTSDGQDLTRQCCPPNADENLIKLQQRSGPSRLNENETLKYFRDQQLHLKLKNHIFKIISRVKSLITILKMGFMSELCRNLNFNYNLEMILMLSC